MDYSFKQKIITKFLTNVLGKYTMSIRSRIKEHAKIKSKLIPPLSQLPTSMKNCSWVDQRLPELLWTVLLAGNLPRELALECFKNVAGYISQLQDKEEYSDITVSSLAKWSDSIFEGFVRALIIDPKIANILGAMLFYNDFPGKDKWIKYLPPFEDKHIIALMTAVARCLDHQGQQATDCRWARCLCMIAGGRLQIPQEILESILEYPTNTEESMYSTVRAMEIAMPLEYNDWAKPFWQQNIDRTECCELPLKIDIKLPMYKINSNEVERVYKSTIEHFHKTQTTCLIDAKHDEIFGATLYSLSILKELLNIGMSTSITGRIGLRTIVECFLTIAYLIKLNSPEKWSSFRIYGAGQAKLASLKIEEGTASPSFITQSYLDAIANEDVWDEFLNIDLGHWDKSNLRNMSDIAGCKDIYDKYYGWSSTYAHAHWGALRDSVFQTCGNPLHRLHRIPRANPRLLPDVIDDAVEVCNKIIDLLKNEYPGIDVSLSRGN